MIQSNRLSLQYNHCTYYRLVIIFILIGFTLIFNYKYLIPSIV